MKSSNTTRAAILVLMFLVVISCACICIGGSMFYFTSRNKTNQIDTNFDFDNPYFDDEMDLGDYGITPLDECFDQLYTEYVRVWNKTCEEDGEQLDLSQTFHCTLSDDSLRIPDLVLDEGKHDCYLKFPEYDLTTYDECIQNAYEYYIQEWNSNCVFLGLDTLDPNKDSSADDKICELDAQSQKRWDDMYERYEQSCRTRKLSS